MRTQLENSRSLCQYFSRSASQYHRHADLQREIAEELAERYLDAIEPRSILELGCGTGFLTRQLVDRFPNATIDAIDISSEMIRLAQHVLPTPRVRWHIADMNQFRSDRAYDLVASSTALHWGDPLDALIWRVRDQLRPGGKLVVAVMSAGTLSELHQLRQEVAPRKTPLRRLPSADELTDYLTNAQMTIDSSTTVTYRSTYPSSQEVLRSLRQTGFTGGPFSRGRAGVLVRSELDALLHLYQQRFGSSCGGVYATFQVTFVVAEAPSWDPKSQCEIKRPPFRPLDVQPAPSPDQESTMKTSKETSLISLNSGAPWHISLDVKRVGPDLLCHLHGGTEHVGAVTLGQWDGQRARVEGLAVGKHKEGPLATFVAHQLCQAGQATTVCLAGIHFDGINQEQIEEIEQESHSLLARASRQLEDLRVAQGLAASDSMFSHIQTRAATCYADCQRSLQGSSAESVAGLRLSPESGRDSKHRDSVLLFAPLYLCNACPNDCAYCGFRRSAKFKRTRLSVEEALREAQCLADTGFRTIDLVTGEITTDAFVAYVCECVEGIRNETPINRINLNLGALSPQQFRQLRSAGATGYHLYQESYDPEVYRQVHRRGRKRDMNHRLEASRWAVEAGFQSIGLGILLGLRDPVLDLARLCAHARVLTEIQPELRIGFSLPRIQPVDEGCTFAAGHDVDDELFTRCILFLRRTFPAAQLTLTTRESPALRDRLLPLGITKISAEVKTAPGGYTTTANEETEQFAISDHRSLIEMTRVIYDLGLEPVL